MLSSKKYISLWQKSIAIEISQLKKFGSNQYVLLNGRLYASNEDGYTYYFDTLYSLFIPIGSSVKVHWGHNEMDGRVLSSEGTSLILVVDDFIGDSVSEAKLQHAPWELLEQLSERLEDIKEVKKKRLRIKHLMNPDFPQTHPTNFTSTIHELVLRSKYNPITFVWGPPGTGKTYTLARTAANHYFKGKSVLVLSHSNQAVDVLMAEISGFVRRKKRWKSGDILRYGNKVSEDVSKQEELSTHQYLRNKFPSDLMKKEQLLSERIGLKKDLQNSFSHKDMSQLLEIEKQITTLLEKIKRKELEAISEAKIVGVTIAKATTDSSIYDREYDIVIVDESSMAYIPQIAFGVTLGRRSIISGDFKQLPPIAASRHELVNEWLKDDIYHKAGVTFVENGQLHPHLLLLNEQRRMHPDISSFTNQFIYGNRVKDHKSVVSNRNELVTIAPFPNRASIMINTTNAYDFTFYDKASKSKINLWNLLHSLQLLIEANEAGHRSIGYISPYRAQAYYMDLLLNEFFRNEKQNGEMMSATVHRFQGSERDVIIFDSVDSYPNKRPGMLLTGNESERLLNVAMTRARAKFIHVTDYNFFKKVNVRGIYQNLLDHQLFHHQQVDPSEIGRWIHSQKPNLQWMHAKKTNLVQQDILQAKHNITVALPSKTIYSADLMANLTLRNVPLELFSKTNIEWLRSNHFLEKDVSFPFILIDQTILWLGIPIEAKTRNSPPFVAIRLVSPGISNMLYKQFKDA
ncbi:DNA helicase [Bacillus coahuilensis p1.1.43]|uniref:DNA helicase n=2 Tax=Bacillus coahuilensis TaxID=408580 RepID=A0A147K903_9BACI|nr:AAA domain-containing protein [Bacillus coahuilensis]KUP06750.1 DNA helicase [Bacillus coahuilensis p1.1.43]